MSDQPPPRTLQLQRPIAFFDLETTGLDTDNDRIVEICVVKWQPNGDREIKTRRVNPLRPIPPDATAVHGIGDADVADCPDFGKLAKGLHALLDGCDLGGYNIERFDVPMLQAEFKRHQLVWPADWTQIVDVYGIFASRERRDLAAAVQFYCGHDLEDAHSAQADVLATIDVLHGQLQRYADLPNDVATLHAQAHPVDPNAIDPEGKFVWRDGEAVINFSKIKGMPLREMAIHERGFLRWMLDKGKFGDKAREIARNALQSQFPVPPTD